MNLQLVRIDWEIAKRNVQSLRDEPADDKVVRTADTRDRLIGRFLRPFLSMEEQDTGREVDEYATIF